MFQKLEQARLKPKPSKHELFCRQITYLGHIVSTQRIATDEGKIDTIKKWPTPTTVTEVQSDTNGYRVMAAVPMLWGVQSVLWGVVYTYSQDTL